MKGPGRRPDPDALRDLIARSGLTIYDPIDPADARFLSPREIEHLLRAKLRGRALRFPIRTRAKVAKALVAEALGYAAPSSFRKTQPRFPGQDLDVYVQKSDNLQIWNEEVDPHRRYALIRLDANDRIVGVRVLTGEAVAKLDPTGTLTSKYQAKRQPRALAEGGASALISPTDTDTFSRVLRPVPTISPNIA
ncbi:MAG: hypothetical protein LAO30_23610, partial [Acidobacteriia bacterium]|nr:hypothetical protein [Terriglobia bacterium]